MQRTSPEQQRSISPKTLTCRSFMLLACVCAMTIVAFAQYRASIQGVVTDPSGAVVPGATVTLTDIATNQTLTRTTSDAGIYNFNALPPSHFSLTVEKTGFKKKVLSDVQLIPEQANALNVQLDVGDTGTSVTVSGSETPALETETASTSGTISSNEIQHLPAFGRDVFQLAQLAPGVFGNGAQAGGGGTQNLPGTQIGGSGSTDGIFKTENGPQIVANGGQNNANGISIDGISTASAVWGGTSVITPSEDSVGDVKIVSNSYDAENGRFSGAQIQVTSKAGSNDIHGSLFFKASRPGLDAYQRWNGPSSEVSGTPAARGLSRDNGRFNQFGGSLGGPIWKNKIFAFFNYETLRNNTVNTGLNNWYETPQFLTQAPSNSIAASILGFPGEGAAFSSILSKTCADIGLIEGTQCLTIPGQGLDVGSPLTSPLGTQDPTYGGGSGTPGVGNGLDGIPDIAFVNTSNPSTVTEVQYNGRVDANIGGNDRITFTIYWVPVETTSYNGPVRPANLYHHSAINDAFAGIWNHIFSPTLLNEARVNAAGWRWNEISTNPQEPFGLPQDNFDAIGTAGGGAGLQFFGAPGPSVFNQWTYSYQDILTKILGRHTLKAGGQVTRLYYLNNAVYNARPSYTFRNVWDFLNDAPYQESGTFNPLTGQATENRLDERSNLWAFFAQDDFKLRPNLTVTLGLRWSYFGPLSSKQGNLSVVQLGSGANTLTNLSLRVGGNLYNAQKGNFGPQVGFAWSPVAQQNRLVIRGGFGINYNQNEIAITANGTNNPPNVVGVNFCCSSFGNTNPSILYGVPSDPHSIFGYPPNPATVSAFGSNNLPLTGGPIAVTGYPANPGTTYTYHYSSDIQYDVGYNWIFTLGYQGSTGRHLLIQNDQNTLGAAAGIPLNPRTNSVDYYQNTGNSSYNALIAGLKHQFSHSFLADAQYTWAKSLDNGSQPYYTDPYPYDARASWGRSDYNVGNSFKIYGMWQPTIFHGSHSWLEKVAGGWSISGIYNLHTGFPWTPEYNNTGGNIYFEGSGNHGYGTLRPALYKGGAGSNLSNNAFQSGPRPSSSGYNQNFPQGALAYFTVPTFTPAAAFPATGPIPQGSLVSRNSFNSSGYNDLDGTLAKAFGLPRIPGLGEGARLEIRADAFNFFNKLNLQGGGQDNGGSISNLISSDGINSNPNFGQAQKALGSRTVQLQARFNF
jgi:hypothetical protein